MEIPLPIEFVVLGTAPSQGASGRTKNAWKQAIRDASKPLLPEMPFCYEGAASVTLYYFPVEVMPGDIDNRIKTVLDAIKGHILKDDNQVLRVVAQVFNPDTTIAFRNLSDTLAEAIGSDEPALYIRISNDPYEELR